MPPLPFNYLIRILRAGSSGAGGGPVPAIDIDLTSSLDSRITFTRAGSRNYINAGVLTALASSNVPAFESWDGISRGMAIEPAFTNLALYSNDFTNAAWGKRGWASSTTGDTGPDGSTAMALFTETATSNLFSIEQIINYSAQRQTASFFVKPKSGGTRWAINLRISAQYNNTGGDLYAMFDGTKGHLTFNDAAMFSNTTGGIDKLANGIYRIWLTGDWTTLSGSKQYVVRSVDNLDPATKSISGAVTEGWHVWGGQVTNTNGPVGYVATGAATASQAAESAIFNDTAWLTTAQGTFIIEHDCYSGTLIGSGTNVVLGATTPGRTAIAWDGSTSDTVSNGGATTVGGLPTFSGSDVRLLSTSAAGTPGHIKSIKFYNTRLSVVQLQALTAPTLTSTATPGVLRAVSVNNRLPGNVKTTAGSELSFVSRFELSLGGSACSELRLDFPNFQWPGDTAVANSIVIDECALERETGVVEYVPVTFSASRSVTVSAGAAATVVSDAILPSSFTGLSTFPAGTKFWVRVKGHVAAAGNLLAAARNTSETGAFGKVYNPGTVTYSPVDSTGAVGVVSGSDVGSETQAYCPILIGRFVSGDPVTLMVFGDSIIEGTGSIGGVGSFVRQAANNLTYPLLEFSKGGRSQIQLSDYAYWRPYLAYVRVLIDELGTNSVNAFLHHFKYWHAARTTYSIDKVVRVGLFPHTTSSDSFATEANQTIARGYPINYPDNWGASVYRSGYSDYYLNPQSVRGTNPAKWLVNGAAFYATSDGVHQTLAGNALLTTEFQTTLASITVS